MASLRICVLGCWTSWRTHAQPSREQMITTKKWKGFSIFCLARAFFLKTVEVRIDRGGTCWGIRPPALTALAENLSIFWAFGYNFDSQIWQFQHSDSCTITHNHTHKSAQSHAQSHGHSFKTSDSPHNQQINNWVCLCNWFVISIVGECIRWYQQCVKSHDETRTVLLTFASFHCFQPTLSVNTPWPRNCHSSHRSICWFCSMVKWQLFPTASADCGCTP